MTIDALCRIAERYRESPYRADAYAYLAAMAYAMRLPPEEYDAALVRIADAMGYEPRND